MPWQYQDEFLAGGGVGELKKKKKKKKGAGKKKGIGTTAKKKGVR